MFCRYCGNEIGAKTRFCSNCGKKVEEVSIGEETFSSYYPKSLKKNQKIISYHLGVVCGKYTYNSPYAEFGNPLSERNSKKYYNAIVNFVIDTKEQVFFIYDTTVFGSCKRGFAICSSGIYGCDNDSEKFYISWNEFKITPYKKSLLELQIGNRKFDMAPGDTKPTMKMLDAIKKYFFG